VPGIIRDESTISRFVQCLQPNRSSRAAFIPADWKRRRWEPRDS
jgi:hypothetical protein